MLISAFIAGGVTVNQYVRPATASQHDESTTINAESSEHDSNMAGHINRKKQHNYMSRKSFNGDVDYNSQNIDNGVVIEMTSTDEATVRRLQERQATKQQHMADKNIRANGLT